MAFEVSCKGFSGPLDVLCALLESREVNAGDVPVHEIVGRYCTYLAKERDVPLTELAEFLSLAARLLLNKARALMPREEPEDPACDEGEWEDGTEEITARLQRYRPYRRASSILAERFQWRRSCFTRPGSEETIWFDLGDLYSLARVWWTLIGRVREDDGDIVDAGEEDVLWNGLPDEVPEEAQVGTRMEQIRAHLAAGRALSLAELVRETPTRSHLVVTFLALLELSRMGEIELRQEGLFGHVVIAA
ncbi:MAG: segregation/condensation protein A [Synergistales bacterium]|nr:segregation/condensation protein A [Synergistales bacterium]